MREDLRIRNGLRVCSPMLAPRKIPKSFVLGSWVLGALTGELCGIVCAPSCRTLRVAFPFPPVSVVCYRGFFSFGDWMPLSPSFEKVVPGQVKTLCQFFLGGSAFPSPSRPSFFGRCAPFQLSTFANKVRPHAELRPSWLPSRTPLGPEPIPFSIVGEDFTTVLLLSLGPGRGSSPVRPTCTVTVFPPLLASSSSKD